ncbi:MAG: DUF433 domain-containing protein [Verrucomicrobia bacterium]|nr:DUF433 domain-containing protein [Verrucomicrobiota bacterium]
MKASELPAVDPNILGGTPVFKGTRVPVKTLFEYLGNNYSFRGHQPRVDFSYATPILRRATVQAHRASVILLRWIHR